MLTFILLLSLFQSDIRKLVTIDKEWCVLVSNLSVTLMSGMDGGGCHVALFQCLVHCQHFKASYAHLPKAYQSATYEVPLLPYKAARQ